jgi:hypothetical protein
MWVFLLLQWQPSPAACNDEMGGVTLWHALSPLSNKNRRPSLTRWPFLCAPLAVATSTVEVTINALVQGIDLTEWVFSLADAEYQARSKAHSAGGTTFRVDGRRMSITVEQVGNPLIQRFVKAPSAAKVAPGRPCRSLLKARNVDFAADREGLRCSCGLRATSGHLAM